MSNKEIKLNIKIANRTYQISAKEGELDSIKETEKILNDKIRNHQAKFGQDIQDTLGMLLFLYTIDNTSSTKSEHKGLTDRQANTSSKG